MKEVFWVKSRLNKQLAKEQEKFFKSYKQTSSERPTVPLFNTSSELIEYVAQDKKIQFLILSEYHDDPHSYAWLEENSPLLAQTGFTVATEFYGMWQQKNLDDYHRNKTKKIPDIQIYSYTQEEDFEWLKRKEHMLKTCKNSGLRVIGIESEESHDVYNNYHPCVAKGKRRELLDKALPFALDKQGLLNSSQKNKVLIWVGAGHSYGMANWLGRERCLIVGCKESISSGKIDCYLDVMDKRLLNKHSLTLERKKRLYLIHQLDHYIERIDGYNEKNIKNPFMKNFWIYKKSRAINREINYLLAKQLRKELEETTDSVEYIFAFIDGKREEIIQENKFQKSPDYIKRNIHSEELNKIIRDSQKDPCKFNYDFLEESLNFFL